MKDTKIFINILGYNYMQKTITLNKGSFSTQYSHFYLNTVCNSQQVKQAFKKDMKKLISKNEVIMSTTDFGRYSIITTGGVIVGDDLPDEITDLAIKKRDNRRKKLDSLDDTYSKNHFDLYIQNKDIIKALLDLQYCYWHEMSTIKDYQQLLECLVGITLPETHEVCEEKAKQLLKEYSKS